MVLETLKHTKKTISNYLFCFVHRDFECDNIPQCPGDDDGSPYKDEHCDGGKSNGNSNGWAVAGIATGFAIAIVLIGKMNNTIIS